MPSSTRVRFDKQLAQLGEDVLQLGSRARSAVERGLQALVREDVDLAREVIAEDVNINRLRYDIEFECYTLLVTEQPVASDMRAIVAALTIVGDLERIADHGKKIARLYLRMTEDPRPIALGEVPALGALTLAMLDRALRSFAARDEVEAEAVCQTDDQADAQYKRTFNAIVSQMVEDPRRITAGTHLIQVAHELERVGDRATNVAERVIYTVTGELIELNI
ncbi:MAG: phosphate signaling complex protein PhoU [Chloroflexi bacterium]|nr:phosphate signaling complex protein PhoU [Chloroflexota bacterium]